MNKFQIGDKVFYVVISESNYYIEEFRVTQITYNTRQDLYFYLFFNTEIHGNNVKYAEESALYMTFDEALKSAKKLIEKDEGYWDN